MQQSECWCVASCVCVDGGRMLSRRNYTMQLLFDLCRARLLLLPRCSTVMYWRNCLTFVSCRSQKRASCARGCFLLCCTAMSVRAWYDHFSIAGYWHNTGTHSHKAVYFLAWHCGFDVVVVVVSHSMHMLNPTEPGPSVKTSIESTT